MAASTALWLSFEARPEEGRAPQDDGGMCGWQQFGADADKLGRDEFFGSRAFN
jgi:hypothetical protein